MKDCDKNAQSSDGKINIPMYAKASTALTRSKEILDKFMHELPFDEKNTCWYKNWQDCLSTQVQYYIGDRYKIMKNEDYHKEIANAKMGSKKWKVIGGIVALLGGISAEHWLGILKWIFG